MPDQAEVDGEQVLAFVSLRDGLVSTEHDLRDRARHRLADFKVPQGNVFSGGLGCQRRFRLFVT